MQASLQKATSQSKGKIDKDHKYDEAIESAIVDHVVTTEYEVSKQNQADATTDFESYLALLESERSEKDYDWMSDIHIPEFEAQHLTQLAMDVRTYFSTREFVECYIQDPSDKAQKAAAATRELINRTLNQGHLHYYLKFLRARQFNYLAGQVYAEAVWEQQVRKVEVATEEVSVELDIDIYDEPMTDPETQIPKIEIKKNPIYDERIVKDRFNFEILDPRNVFVIGNGFLYNLQDADGVIVRCEKRLDQLKKEKDAAGYFNLELLEDVKVDNNTDTAKETYNKEDQKEPQTDFVNKWFDILKRHGQFWCVVDEFDEETGLPLKISPPYDDSGELKESAELHNIVVTIAQANGKNTLIGFHPTPYLDVNDEPYIPVFRGICYPHPTDDSGFGDAKHAKDLQVWLDDTINISNDRTKLATIPTFQVNRFAMEDNDTLYFEPGHPMMVNQVGDIQEFKIGDNIQGAMAQAQFARQSMQQLSAIFPNTMGGQVAPSTTATAIAGAEGRSDARSHFKALTYENTFEQQLYWMIQQMTWRFAKEETAFKLMGELVYDFDPAKDYWFKPLSQSVENDASKAVKIRNIMQFAQVLQPYAQLYANDPNFKEFLNYLFLKFATLSGDEVENVANKLLNPKIKPEMKDAGSGNGSGQPATLPAPAFETPASNQSGMAQSPGEMMARGTGQGSYQ